ncbi:MAG: polyphosphate kinase 2 family protein [Christensenellaceae bacterium]|nr:polyphosphate kinase 2 family protein [Christensenellaceae bacterium]
MKTEKYLVKEGQRVTLSDYSTERDIELNREDVENKLMPENIRHMANLQEKLYAENTSSLLIVFQAMDAAGKDSAIKHVMKGFNPQGVHVASFKVPSSEENDHDYLWRIHRQIPRRGEIGIFNRSHYEDVLVSKVHNLISTSQLPPELKTDDIFNVRYRQICDYERYLFENGTVIVKFFLHLSKDEQRERLLERIENPDKNWKFSASDIHERQYWDMYMQAYETMLENTSTQFAPWYILPADSKWYTRYLISEILLEKLTEMDPQFPEFPEEKRGEMEKCRELLLKEISKD